MFPPHRVWLLAAALLVAAVAIGAALVVIPRDRPFDEASLPARVSLDEVALSRTVRLPACERAGLLPPDDEPLIVITSSALLVGLTPVTEVTTGEPLATPAGFRGLEAHRGKELLVRPLQFMLEAARERTRTASTDAIAPSGVRLAFSPDTPYYPAIETLHTALQAELGIFHLLVDTPVGRGALTLSTPRRTTHHRPRHACTFARFSALVRPDRLDLRGSYFCGPSEATSRPVSGQLLASDGRLPRADVIAAARRLYPQNPDFLQPDFTLTALAETPWQLVVDAIAGLQAAGTGGEIDPFRPREKQPEDDPQISLALPARSPEEWSAKHEAEDETWRRQQEQLAREVERMRRETETMLERSR